MYPSLRYLISLPQRYRHTDGQTTALCVAYRAVNGDNNDVTNWVFAPPSPLVRSYKQESLAIAKMTARCALCIPTSYSP